MRKRQSNAASLRAASNASSRVSYGPVMSLSGIQPGKQYQKNQPPLIPSSSIMASNIASAVRLFMRQFKHFQIGQSVFVILAIWIAIVL
jgi:hypothetical protein